MLNKLYINWVKQFDVPGKQIKFIADMECWILRFMQESNQK